jgi:hypothetical protein
VVRLDAAWWGKASFQPAKILGIHLRNADPSIIEDYARIDEADVLRDAMLSRPGVTIDVLDLMTRGEYLRGPLYVKYGRKHRVEAVIGTSIIEPVSSMVDFLTVWRFDARWRFSEDDRLLTSGSPRTCSRPPASAGW